MNYQTDYPFLLSQLKAVTDAETDTIANLSNAGAVLHMNLEDINLSLIHI